MIEAAEEDSEAASEVASTEASVVDATEATDRHCNATNAASRATLLATVAIRAAIDEAAASEATDVVDHRALAVAIVAEATVAEATDAVAMEVVETDMAAVEIVVATVIVAEATAVIVADFEAATTEAIVHSATRDAIGKLLSCSKLEVAVLCQQSLLKFYSFVLSLYLKSINSILVKIVFFSVYF
jgi:hypothetical protein